jgi:hypothetical protein
VRYTVPDMYTVKKFFFAAVLFIIMCAFFRAPSAHAETTIGADIMTNTTWTLAGSPYVLTKQIFVKNGVTFTIEPGVVVSTIDNFSIFPNPTGIEVLEGTFVAHGTLDALIRIDTVAVQISGKKSKGEISNANIRGVIAKSSPVSLRSVTMGYLSVAGNGAVVDANTINVTGDISYSVSVSSLAKVTIQDSVIGNKNATYPAIFMSASLVTVKNTVINSGSICVHIYRTDSTFDGDNLLVENCQTGFLVQIGVSDQFDHNVVRLHNSEIAGNHLGFDIRNKPQLLDITNNSIHHNTIGATYDRGFMAKMSANWWGDASGPMNALSNPDGLGDAVNEFITFVPWLTDAPFPPKYVVTLPPPSEPAPDPEPVLDPVPDPDPVSLPDPDPVPPPAPTRTPVLIIPGVLGTEMSDGAGNKLWLDISHTLTGGGDSFMDPLGLNPDFTPSDTGVVLGDVIRKETVLQNLAKIFDYSFFLIKEFQLQGYEEDVDLFVFPYDWRYGVNDSNVNLLSQKISDIKSQTGSTKVDIIAHSTGGLLVKKYIVENVSNHYVGKAIFVGVPNTGAPAAIKNLLHGNTFGMFFLSASEMKKLSRNMPVAYDLAPSSQYFANAGSYMQVIDQVLLKSSKKNLGFDEIIDRLKSRYDLNIQGIDNALALHTPEFDNYDLRTAGVDLYAIDGCKTGTIGKITELRSKTLFGGETIGYSVTYEAPGDGTVPLASSTNLPINQLNKFYALKADHAKMMSQDGIREQIVNILSGSTLEVKEKLITQDISKCQLTGRMFSVYSPLSIDVVDGEGNHAGVSSDGVSIENTIPNADYQILGEHKFVYLPTDEGQTYTITVVGTGTGTFTLTDASIVNGVTTGMQVFSDIPVTPSLRGMVVLGSTTTLALDTGETLEPSEMLDADDAQDFYPNSKSVEPEPEPVSNTEPVLVQSPAPETRVISPRNSGYFQVKKEDIPAVVQQLPNFEEVLSTLPLAMYTPAESTAYVQEEKKQEILSEETILVVKKDSNIAASVVQSGVQTKHIAVLVFGGVSFVALVILGKRFIKL